MNVYKITNMVNGKIYIGKAEKSIQERFLAHIDCAKKKVNKHLYDAMNHYGFQNFDVNMVEKCNSIKELNEKEMYWIKFFNSTDKNIGYNIALGGTGGDTFTSQSTLRKKEICKKRSKSMIGKNKGKKLSQETKEKLRIAFTGKHPSIEARKKMSASAKIAQNRPEVKEKRSKSMTGKKHSPETNLKVSKVLKGKLFTEEHLKNVRLANTLRCKGKSWTSNRRLAQERRKK